MRTSVVEGLMPEMHKLAKLLVGNKAMGESQNGCFRKTKHAKFFEK